MSRKKGVGNDNGNSGRLLNSGDSFSWINVSLDISDDQRCSELASDPSQLAHGFVGLTAVGLDISLKHTDGGDFMACAYGSDSAGRRLGLSAWGETASDAVAGLLVKWYDKLDGSLEGVPAVNARPRFR